MGEFLNISDVEFLEYFCRYSNLTLLAIACLGYVFLGTHKATEERASK